MIAGSLMLVAFVGLFGRFVYLQLVLHQHYQTLAESNRIAIVPIAPNRGVITDRNGVVLAQSYSGYTLEVTPSRVKNLDAMIDELARVVDVQPRDRKRFKRLLEDSKNFESLPLRTRLSDEEVARFAVNRYRFPGVEIKARLFRQYPFGETASHLIGYIGRINDRDVKRIEEWGDTANYKGSDYIGKVGVEISYERELHGTTGVEEVEVDAGGRAVRTLSRRPPTSGNNLRLALDIKLQQVAERAFGDRRGALVALDPSTGEVLAFVSKPGFDPNLFVEGIDPASWDQLNESPDKPMLNRPLRGAYPPGSTIKPFLALGALASGKRTPTQTIFDPGLLPDRRQHAPLPRRQAGRPRLRRHVQVDRRVVRHLLLHARRRTPTSTTRTRSCRNSASAARPASTSRASCPACCPRASGSANASPARIFATSTASGIWAIRFRRASARDTTPSRRSSRRRRSPSSPTTASALRPHVVKSIENIGTRRSTADCAGSDAHSSA